MRGAFPFPLTTVHHPLLTHRSPLSQYKRFRATIPGIDRYVVKWHPLMSPYVAFIYLCVRIAFGSSDDLDFDIPLVKIQQIAKGCVVSDCDDDGEHGAGAKLAALLELTGAENVLLVVSRWFGGILLGPDRFKCFAKAGSELLEAEGLASRGKGKRK